MDQNQNLTLNPYYVSGFDAAEPSFVVVLRKMNSGKIGWQVSLCLSSPRVGLGLHQKDLDLLKRIQLFFAGVGKVHSLRKDSCLYRVESLSEITNVIIPHFEKYPLITQKQADFLLFKEVADLMNRKEHLTMEWLQKILNIRASMN